MKRKLNAKFITLISLICALICAVIAGFAFVCSQKTTGEEGTTITRPELSANAAYYSMDLEPRISSDKSRIKLGESISVSVDNMNDIYRALDSYTYNNPYIRWCIEGGGLDCSYDMSLGESFIEYPTETGWIYIYADVVNCDDWDNIVGVGADGNEISIYVEKGDQTPSISGSSSVAVDKTITLSGSGYGSYSWSSSNTGVATVSSSGVVTGKSVGTTTITLTASGNSNYNSGTATKTITVTKGSQTPSISGSSSVAVDSAITLSGSGYGSYSWSSSNTSIATVNSSGVVTGKAVGSVTITMTAAGNTNYNSGTATKSISVTKGSQSTPSISGNSSVDYGSTITLTASGGKGTGAYTWSVASASGGATASFSTTSSVTSTTGSSVTLKGTRAGGTVTVTMYRASSTNYNASSSITKTITINKVTPTATASLQSGNRYIGSRLDSVGITGNASVSGKFAWTNGSTTLTASGTYGWTFTPNDTTNYNNVTGTLDVTAIAPLDRIEVTGAKTNYVAYESFTTSGMIVTAYGGGNSKQVTGYTITRPYDGTGRAYFLVSDNNSSVTVTYTESGTTVSATIAITVGKATFNMSSVSWNYTSPFTYDENPKTVSLKNLPAGVGANYSNNSKTEAGSYIASVASWDYDSVNYKEPSFSTTCSWTINRAGIEQPTYSPATVLYSPNNQTITLSPASYITIQQPAGWGLNGAVITIPGGTVVGNYTVTVTPDKNHKWSSGSNVEGSRDIDVSIGKATYNMTGVSWNYTSPFVYNTEPHTVTLQNLPEGVKVNAYSGNSATDADNYVASVTAWDYDTTNYNVPTIANCNWKIEQATPTVSVNVNTGDGIYYYIGDYLNGVTLSLVSSSPTGTVAWTYPTSKISGEVVEYEWTFTPDAVYTKNYKTVTGKYLIEAVYKVTDIEVTSANADYTAFDTLDEDSIVITATYLMNKAPAKVTGWTFKYPGENNYFTYADNGKKVVFTYTESGITKTCTLTVSVDKQTIDLAAMGVSMSNKTETYDPAKTYSIVINGTLDAHLISLKGYTYNGDSATGAKNADTYTVEAVFELADPANYIMPKLSATLTINKAQATLDVSGVQTVYDYKGVLQTVESGAIVNNSEQTQFTYTNNTFTTVAEGNGKVVTITVEGSDNYLSDTKTVTLTVNKAEVELTWTGGDGVYDGKEHNATLTVTSGVFDRDASAVTTDTLKPYLTITYTTEGGDEARKHVGTYAPSYTGYPAGEPFCNYTPVVTNPEYTFTITEADVTGISFSAKTFEYDGNSHVIEITGTLPGEVTVSYTIDGEEFTGVTDAGTYTITPVFACESGNYTLPEIEPATITITPRKIVDGNVSGIDKTYIYKGEAWKPEPVVELTLKGATGATTLVADRDYTVDYDTEDYDAGTTVTVTVEGIGNYSETVTRTFTIEKATITRDWVGDSFTYNGEGQGLTVNFSGIASSDSDKVAPKVIYSGSGSTVYTASEKLPVDAGNYIATIIFETNDSNYINKVINNEFKRFTIRQAHLDADDIDYYVEEQSQYYAGGMLPLIGLNSYPIFNSEVQVEGNIDWQKSGDAKPPLKAGTNDYVWVFTPDNKNFAQTTGTYTISNVLMPNIARITVEWKGGKQPKLFTSTTLNEVRDYLVVKGIQDNGLGTLEIADYELTGSWGAGDKPTDAEAKEYTLTVTVTVAEKALQAFLDSVYYDEVTLNRITVTAVGGGNIKTSYEAFDTLDRSKIIVTAIYSDGEEVVVEDYEITYPEGRDCFWASAESQILNITYGDLKAPYEISVNVSQKIYDISGLGIENRTETYDGTVKSYALKDTFGIGTVDCTYWQYNENNNLDSVRKSDVKNAGTYIVRIVFNIVGSENIANYKALDTQEVTLTITKAVYENVDDIEFEFSSAVYDSGNSLADKMTVKNVPDGVNVVYEYKDASGKALSADKVVNAGVYTVTAKFETDENHSGIKSISTKFTVSKAKPAVNPIVGGSLSKGTKLYALTFADDSAVKGTFKWVNDEQELQAGVNRCHYTFTPDDTANYETVSGYIDLSVSSITEEQVANGGNLSVGLTVAIIIGMAACLFVAVIALALALKKPKAVADSDGFYENASEEDMK